MRVEAVSKAAAVDVEGFEDLQDGVDGDAPGVGPADDVEIFLAGFEAVEDAVEEEGVVVELALEQAEVAAVQLDPEAFALQVLQPAGPEVAPPVTLHPAADGGLAQIAAGFLALDPLEAQRFLLAVDVDAGLFHVSPLSRLTMPITVGRRSHRCISTSDRTPTAS